MWCCKLWTKLVTSSVSPADTRERVVVDASAVVDLLSGAASAGAVRDRLRGTVLHAPAHLDAEVLSALGRMWRAGELTVTRVDAGLERFAAMPVTRSPLADLLAGAWARRDSLRLVDALYVELAGRLNSPLLTLDRRLARATSVAEVIVGRR